MANLLPNIPETMQTPEALATQLPWVVSPPAFIQQPHQQPLQQTQQGQQQFFQQLQEEHQRLRLGHERLQQEHMQLLQMLNRIEAALRESCVFPILNSHGI